MTRFHEGQKVWLYWPRPPVREQFKKLHVAGVKIRHFRRKTCYMLNSKTVQDRRIVSIKVEQEVICDLSNGDV